jgi:hypothetical protein
MRKTTSQLYVYFILALFLVLPANALIGQQKFVTQSYHDFMKLQPKSTLSKVVLSENDIQGSPYLKDEFTPGDIITKDDIIYKNVPLRYNIYNDDIEFEMSKGAYLAISNPKKMKEIRIDEDVFVYAIKRKKKGEQYGYYKLVEDGEIQLLSRYNIVFKEATNTTGYKAAEPPKFNRNANSFYVKLGTKEPQQLGKKKEIEKVFGSESKEILSYIKKTKLNIRKEQDLVKLVQHLNKSH